MPFSGAERSGAAGGPMARSGRRPGSSWERGAAAHAQPLAAPCAACLCAGAAQTGSLPLNLFPWIRQPQERHWHIKTMKLKTSATQECCFTPVFLLESNPLSSRRSLTSQGWLLHGTRLPWSRGRLTLGGPKSASGAEGLGENKTGPPGFRTHFYLATNPLFCP